MNQLNRLTVLGRYALSILAKLYGLLNRILVFLVSRSDFRQSRELARRDLERPDGGTGWFTPAESSLAHVLASLIIPADDVSPGAQDAEVVTTLERTVANSLQGKEQYARSLYSFDEWARWKHGVKFIKLPHEHQLALLKMIEQESQDPAKNVSLGGKVTRKFRHLRYLRRGLLPAVELFPTVVDDMVKAFYTSEVSWAWLGYDGPPMPDGYPDLSMKRFTTHESQTTTFDSSPQDFNSRRQILVCLKQVPSKYSHYTIDKSGYGVVEEDLAYETNEIDLYAFEEGLRLRRKLGWEITVLSVGQKRVLKILREALAKGADRAIYVAGSGFQDNDNAFATAKTIAAAMNNGKYDLVLMGVESGDMAYGQTGVLLAELLRWPCVTFATDIAPSEDWVNVMVRRELGNSSSERLEVPLPAVLTIQSSTIELSSATLKGILGARKKEIRSLTPTELGLTSSDPGTGNPRSFMASYISRRRRKRL